jgi:hypothetical protein
MKKLTFIITSLFISLITFAGEVTEQEALQKAQQFMQGKHFKQKNLRRAATTISNAYYVFNAENNGGFVIVSADDRTESILGYAEQGTLNVNQLPENAKKWLEGYEQQIKALGNSSLKYNISRHAIGAPIAPLVTAQWSQDFPFNNQCPIVDGERCVTGCVATAMAQVMYFHKYPKTTVGPIEGYTYESNNLTVPELPATTFKWDKMKDRYDDYQEKGESVDAVAELMRYCGQAVEMFYTPWASTCFIGFADRMVKYFGYSKTALGVNRSDYTTKDWEALMYQELKENRPVLYAGNNDFVGHQFIIDGYDENGLFHVNWGYSGGGDGYFVLSVLNAFDYGIGDTVENGYACEQTAIIGLQPDHGEEAVSLLRCNPGSPINDYTRTDAEDFEIKVDAGLISPSDITVDFRWVLCQDGSILKEFEPQSDITLQAETWVYKSATLSFGASLTDGVYEVRPMYRPKGTDSWRYCDGLYYWGFFLATINGTSLILKNTSEIEDIYQINSIKLDGTRKTLRGMTATINWTNKGYGTEKHFYLWEGGESPLSRVSSYLDHNETEDLKINFAPTKAGTITYEISTDYWKENVIWTSEPQTIVASLQHKLTGEITIAGEKNDLIEGTTIDATITIKNEGENAYNDKINIALHTLDENNGNAVCDTKTIREDLSLAVGEQKTIPIQFTDLTKGQFYLLQVRYYSLNETNDRVMPYDVANNYITVGKPCVAHDMEIDMVVKNAKYNMIEGNTVKMDITLKNKGDNDYNDKIEICAIGNPDDEDSYHMMNQIVYVDVPAGQTKTLSDYEFTNLKIGSKYQFIIYYLSENISQIGKGAGEYYTLVESIEYIPGDANGDGLVNVTDIVATVNFIMEKPVESFNKEAADLNGDGDINVTDIVMMVSIIMNGGNQ